ncbi:MAG: YkgJ family cysteine cluster protein [Desulfobacterales bacterium]|nr:YkgJ family cysteine cluster protein [Desulfobacterales bacterium]
MSTARHSAPTDEREHLVVAIHAAADAAIAGELARLRDEGIVPSCHAGCGTCCSQHIVTNRLEMHALGQHIRRCLTPERVEALRLRVREWNRREDAGRDGMEAGIRLCPLLENDRCSIYSARPLICRAHFASTDPAWCRAAVEGEARAGAARLLDSVLQAAAPFKRSLAEHVDRELAAAGLPREESITLLPQGLAEEMGWDRLR